MLISTSKIFDLIASIKELVAQELTHHESTIKYIIIVFAQQEKWGQKHCIIT